jgi:hypothetical protein
MTQQLELGFRQSAPTVDKADLAQLLHQLTIAPSWMQASHLTALTGFSDRKLRALANASGGQIISSPRGYRLTRHATIEEISRCTATLRSQANAMTDRAIQIDRVYHGHATP